jgi:hypothetical protein
MDETEHVAEIARARWLDQIQGVLETLNEGVLIADGGDHPRNGS